MSYSASPGRGRGAVFLMVVVGDDWVEAVAMLPAPTITAAMVANGISA